MDADPDGVMWQKSSNLVIWTAEDTYNICVKSWSPNGPGEVRVMASKFKQMSWYNEMPDLGLGTSTGILCRVPASLSRTEDP